MKNTNSTLANQLKEALDLWVELTNVDPNGNTFSINLGGSIDTFTVSQMHKEIKEALDLDHSNVTGFFLLDALSTRYFNERSFSVDDLLKNPEKTSAYLIKVKRFKLLVKNPEIQDIGNQFILSMQEALHHYEADTDAAMRLLADYHEIAYLRCDALRSMEKLRVDQFLSGQPESSEVRPAYNEFVHQFWNINSLIEAASCQPSGVTLNLVRDPDDYQSYFAFAIRNGGNLFVLSDVPMLAHPLQKYMSRRPDRSFERRASQNWFPYGLMNIAFDDEGRLYFDNSVQRGIVPFQAELVKLKRLRFLQPPEIIWIIMMFNLIIERFWNKGFQAKELSYTGQMIKEESRLIDSAKSTGLQVINYQLLDLPAIAITDVLTKNISETAIGITCSTPNRWMEERYGEFVSDDVVNLVSNSRIEYYLEPPENAKTRMSISHKNHDLYESLPGGIVKIDKTTDAELHSRYKNGRYLLHAMDATSFGTREEIVNNRLFLARYNLAKSIQKLADKEFNDRHEEIKKWWSRAVNKNIKTIYQMASVLEVWRHIDRDKYPHAEININGYHSADEYVLSQRCDDERSNNLFRYGYNCELNLTGGFTRDGGGRYLCQLNETRASYHVVFQPQTPDDLAELAGCSVNELPDVLQHWSRGINDHHNHILDRVDPMLWALINPFSKMKFTVMLALSIRGLKAIQKQYAPPNNYLSEHIDIVRKERKSGLKK